MNLRYHVFYDETCLIYQGVNKKQALRAFEAYKKLSRAPGNRVTGKNITLYDDYTLIKEYLNKE